MSSSGNSQNGYDVAKTAVVRDEEKSTHVMTDFAKTEDQGAVVLDVHQLRDGTQGEIKTAADGYTLLIPQPSSDPNDPLNWNSSKKHIILIILSFNAFIPDFASSMGVVTLLPQSMQWMQPPNTIQHNLAGNLFTLGAGGLVTIWLSNYFGRLPVLFYFTSMALATCAWCAAATSFNSYLAARILNGFFSIIAQSGGLMWIQDIFFFHEHPRKINIWSAAIIVSPYLGPLFTAFIINKMKWPVAFWVSTGMTALGWLLIVAFMDETIYNRNIPQSEQPVPNSRLLRLLGIEQWHSRHQRQSCLQAFMRPIRAISKLPVLLCTVYYFLNFAWVIGVNATISIWLTSIYKFTPYNLGFFYFAPIIGSVFGAVAGHWLHDLVGTFYLRRHSNTIVPEARLIIVWLASPLMAISVLIIGFALQRVWSYWILAVFFAAQVCGIMIATVALNAYLLDSYPEGSGEVDAWIVVGRTLGGFMATYIEINWVTESGPQHALGAQAGITAAAALIILALGFLGKKLRLAQGPIRFAM